MTKRILEATLPDERVITRNTERNYVFVVCAWHEQSSRGWEALLWTSRKDLANREVNRLLSRQRFTAVTMVPVRERPKRKRDEKVQPISTHIYHFQAQRDPAVRAEIIQEIARRYQPVKIVEKEMIIAVHLSYDGREMVRRMSTFGLQLVSKSP